MASPLTVKRNDYHANKKNSTIYTPVGVSQFLFDILAGPTLHRAVDPGDEKLFTAFDPAIGSGILTDPWYQAGCRVLGCDIASFDGMIYCHDGMRGPFETCEWPPNWGRPDIVLCNPPFNGAPGKRLYPEVFLEHIFKLFGPRVPTVLFTPMGFRLNQRRKSTRWRWLRDGKAEITSIISLPLDTFLDVEFHVEILIFNVDGIKPHYFLPESAL